MLADLVAAGRHRHVVTETVRRSGPLAPAAHEY